MKDWFYGLEERERWFLIGGAAALVLALIYLLLLNPLFTETAERSTRVEQKEKDLAWMQKAAATIVARGPANGGPKVRGTLVVIVDQTARSAGLGDSLKANQPTGPNSIRVRLDSASFDALVRWLGELQTNYQIQIQSATFDGSGGGPGIVNASVILERPGA